MSIPLKTIIAVFSARCHGDDSSAIIEHVSIDSRSSHNGVNTLFFALIGPNNNGHVYIPELIEEGVRNFVVSYIPEGLEEKANFLVVENTLVALQKFAIYYRGLFDFPVIGITGSNGKTIVKEWLNFLLSPDFNIIRSPKSFNSQVGVPLSVIAINEKHNLGIFEAGISTVAEMDKLEPIVKPTIGVLTNIGTSHDEGFESTAQKISEKLKLFQNSEILIYKRDSRVDSLIFPQIKTFSWSFEDKTADVYVSQVKSSNHKTNIWYQFNGDTFEIEIPFEDMASIENAISCLLVLLYLKYDNATIHSRMALLYPVQMRLEVKNGINNCNLIDDSYSSDFQSLKIALDFLESQNKFQKKTLILSDIFQSGLSDEELYGRVAKLVVANNIERVIGIGETISAFKDRFVNCITYKHTADFLADFENLDFANETILVKGARSFEFEEIVAVLEQKKHETVLEINLNALSYNLNFFKAKLKPKVKIMVMVKAFGYGNGGLEIASLLEHHQVDYLGVAFADEGISLKNDGIRLPIMVLNPESTSFSSIIQYQLEPEIYTLRGLNNFLKVAEHKNLSHFPIHIKIDTGMHRLGFERNDIPELIQTLKGNSRVQVKSILSHMATSDDEAHYDFAKSQIRLFDELSLQIMTELGINPIRHILNSSGISNFPEAQFNMVRLGIGIYGVSNDPEEQKYLENVGTLKSIISQIRTIPAGDSVGYGRRFMAQKETKVGTIPIGYADGISRAWGNGVGYVMIKNKKARILGSVCMDMLMVDITEIDCVEGDDVIIFGESPTVVEIAKALHTIPYEILTSISQRVKRVFYR
ncbi:bifunctional UDP-N-acetylmuramoyl-tripeptide:D-alanyl-D-alanine ligase/alanine racemase [Flavobacterium faecale]|uniref:bifunctional UDP-N-acetylmuramoyl-tripeptide:D-alanyl-D-alanine ligase/alanine racemase n=1 Tax=Flavobacterium faecale TaxID=1355330 RepID=UPI003AAA2BBD